jgi:hypothetical protein
MTRFFLIGFLSVLLMSAATQAAAVSVDGDLATQSSTAEESLSNEVRWYQVELLIFKQRPISTEVNETWPKDITLSYPDNWDTLKTPDEYQALYQKKSFVNTPFILLDKKYFQLSSLKNKLQINRNDILFHGAWRQSLKQNLEQKGGPDSTSLLIRGGASFDEHTELEGSISLSLLRYLHVDTNLWLTRFAPQNNIPVPATEVEAENTDQASVINWPELPVFPLLKTKVVETASSTDITPVMAEKKYQVEEIVINKQSRRMRSYETHYIDHPKFGILIRLIPLDSNSLLPIPPKK